MLKSAAADDLLSRLALRLYRAAPASNVMSGVTTGAKIGGNVGGIASAVRGG